MWRRGKGRWERDVEERGGMGKRKNERADGSNEDEEKKEERKEKEEIKKINEQVGSEKDTT